MSLPEVTPYGDDPRDANSKPNGVFYRYDGAVHFNYQRVIESEKVYEHVDFSTPYGPQEVRTAYEQVFGIPAAVLGEEDDEDFDAPEEASATAVSMSLGPACEIVVEDENLQIGWLAVHAVFYDREEETAKVMMTQSGHPVDFRHKELVRLLADASVIQDLDTLLPLQ